MYCTEQDLIDRFSETEIIQLSDNNNTGAIDSTVVAMAISDADGEIDGYLASRFALPVNPVPKVLLRIACDLTRYYLYDDSATDHVQKRYDDAVKFLKGVAAGSIAIGINALGEKPESQNLPEFDSGGNVFNRDDKSFI